MKRMFGANGGRGFTFVEVLVAVFIGAIVAAGIFSVAVTGARSTVRIDHKTIAAASERSLSNQLKGFVTSYYDYSAGDFITTGVGEIAGPANSNLDKTSWMWAGYGGTSIADAMTAPATCGTQCYALAVGTHTLTGYLPSWFEAAPYKARISYYVLVPAGAPDQLAVPYVSITTTWNEVP